MNAVVIALALAPLALAPAPAMTGDPSPETGAGVLQRARALERRIEAGDLDAVDAALAEAEFPPLVAATLRGRLVLARGRPELAVAHFERARQLAPEYTPLRVLLAHALLAAERPRAVLEVLEHPALTDEDPGVALLRAVAHEALENPELAYRALRRAARAEPDHAGVVRELVVVTTRHGLYAPARRWAQTLTPAELGREVVLALLQEIRSSPDGHGFAQWLAAAFPDDADIQAGLGAVASAAGAELAAARAYEQATRLGGDYGYAAAEHFRVIRRYDEALRMNSSVHDRERQLAQRFDILFEAGKLARAVILAEALADSFGLSSRRRYNLAYAHYALDEHARASRHARLLLETEEAGRARLLLRAMGR